MTISIQDCTITDQGNGVTSTFDYNFIIPFQPDGVTPAVTVYTIDPSGNQVTLSPSKYTISGVGYPNVGGAVTYIPDGGLPLPTGWEVIIDRNLDYTQPIAVANQSFTPHTVEVLGDYLEMQIQQLARDIQRLTHGPGANTFLGLSDVLVGVLNKTYAGRAGQIAVVNNDETGMDLQNPGVGTGYDATFEFLGGTPPLSFEIMALHPLTRPVKFPVDGSNHLVGAVWFAMTPPSSDFTITVYKNGLVTQIGTIVVHTDGTATFTSVGGDINLIAGDVIVCQAQNATDPSLTNACWAFKGVLQ